MPFSNKGELLDATILWMDRNDIQGEADDFLTLAESGLNRELAALEVDTAITGTISSDEIDISTDAVNVPISLWMPSTTGQSEIELLKLGAGTFPQLTPAGTPTIWSYEDDTIVFDRPLGAAYTFRLHHTINFNLVDDTDTNWLLTNHPDVYFSAVIVWGALFAIDSEMASMYAAPLNSFVTAVNKQAAKRKKGKLRTDPALRPLNRYYPMFQR